MQLQPLRVDRARPSKLSKTEKQDFVNKVWTNAHLMYWFKVDAWGKGAQKVIHDLQT